MYKVVIDRRVYKDLERIPTSDLDKIYGQIISLEDNPRPVGVRKLKGYDNRYRIRQGDYRIVYIIDDAAKVIKIMLIGHRKDVY